MMDHVRAVSESQLSAVFTDLADHALVGMTVVLNARFLYANQKCCELFGYSKEEFIQLNSENCSETAEGVARESEGRS